MLNHEYYLSLYLKQSIFIFEKKLIVSYAFSHTISNIPVNHTIDNMITTQVQSELDALKTEMSDQVYKTLCDKLMSLNQEERSPREFAIYDTTLLVPKLESEGDDERTFNMLFTPEKRLLKMKIVNAEIYMNKIKMNGFCKIHTSIFDDYVKQGDEMHIHSFCEDCEDVAHLHIDIQYPEVIATRITKSSHN